jgi:hypothetical protein
MPALGLEFEKGVQLRDLLRLPDGDERKEALLEELAYSGTLLFHHFRCSLSEGRES